MRASVSPTQVAAQWTNKSKSGGPDYTTVLATDGRLLCNCRGWTIRKNGAARQCTHTRKAVEELGGAVEERGEFAYLVQGRGSVVLPRAVGTVTPSAAAAVTVKADIDDGRPRPPAPMLASAMTEPVKDRAFDARFGGGDWLMEEKLDGHRCVVVITGKRARGGNRQTGDLDIEAFSRPRAGGVANRRDLPDQIVAALRHLEPGIYDGELVAASGKAWDVVSGGAQLVLVLFDVLTVRERDLAGEPYHARRRALLRVLATLPPTQMAVSTVESVAPRWKTVEAIWQRGGEGVILKRAASPYHPGKRSTDWIKVKQAHAATLVITGYEAGKSGPFSTIALVDQAGHSTTVKTPDLATLRAITKSPDAFLGRRVVITYQEMTPAGAYRHGMFDHFAGPGE